MKAKILGKSWDLSSLWNEALHTIPQRPLQPRGYIYASELGGSYVDRYLKMQGHPMTNPPNDRSLRKFSAGHMFEWIVGMVLTMTGLLKEKQLKGEYQMKNCLPVVGKLDFIAGGAVDWAAARAEVENLKKFFGLTVNDMPPIVLHSVDKILTTFERLFNTSTPKEVIFEVKSVSSFMSDRLQRTREPMAHHKLQCLHYLLSNDMSEGYLFYICKDDMISHQFSVMPDDETMKKYIKDVYAMTDFYNKNKMPPIEEEVIFDDLTFRFNTNYKVEYSPYLSMLYPYNSPMAYRETWDSRISSWNRVFKRCVLGEKMTAKNLEVIADAKSLFPHWELMVGTAASEEAFEKETI